ncbi:patatin-like phospholipase family protein [Cetobacterium somerae]
MSNFLEKTMFPNKFNKADLVGLCLSGGGYRSAIFCFGVLKKLHELNYLSKVDYLSAISGGSWIGTSYSVAKNLDDFFKGNLLQKHLENHILDISLKSIPLSQNWVSDWLSKSLYEDFLSSIPNEAPFKEQYFDFQNKPFLIVGSCFENNNKHNRVDLTPLYSYSKKYGVIENSYLKTPSNNKLIDFEVSHSIACSGAALGIDIASIGLLGGRKVLFNGLGEVLTDGGHYENLGIEALVDRDCNKIIICDAEYDPENSSSQNHQKFQGLKTFFKNINFIFSSEILATLDISNQPVNVIELTIPNKTLEILYIKLKKIDTYPKEKIKDNDFPHYKTSKLKYSKEEFDNLSGLGEYIVENNINIFNQFF